MTPTHTQHPQAHACSTGSTHPQLCLPHRPDPYLQLGDNAEVISCQPETPPSCWRPGRAGKQVQRKEGRQSQGIMDPMAGIHCAAGWHLPEEGCQACGGAQAMGVGAARGEESSLSLWLCAWRLKVLAPLSSGSHSCLSFKVGDQERVSTTSGQASSAQIPHSRAMCPGQSSVPRCPGQGHSAPKMP